MRVSNLKLNQISQYKIFETERLILKPTTEDDADFIFELFNTPKWVQYIGDRNIKTIEDARGYIKTKMIAQLKRLGFSNYTLIRKADNCRVGICGLYDRDGVEGIEIGFAILPQYEKKGYAFESANKLKEVAFNEFGLTELKAITVKENISSQKLLERLGLKINGTIVLQDDDKELLLYKLKR